MFWYKAENGEKYRRIGRAACYPSGAELDFDRHITLLEKGICALYTVTLEGNERIFLYFKPGNLVGFLKHILPRDKYPGSQLYKARHRVIAKTSLEVVQILKEDFFDLVREDAGCRNDYTVALAQNLSNMLEHSALVACEVAPVRVCTMLLELSEEDDGRRLLPRCITQNEIANFLSLHKVTVAKVLKSLKEAGGIQREGRRIEVLDPGLLARVVARQEEIGY